MQAITPAAARHQTAGEFVDDDDLAVLHHIVLIAVVKVSRTQSSAQVVHQRDVGRVVQARACWDQSHLREHSFGFFMAIFGQEDLVRFFIDREVAGCDDALASAWVGLAFLAGEQRHDLVHSQVSGCVVFRLPTDDQGRTGLVDQDRVHLVNDGIVERTLHTVMGFVDHVVAQVIETVFVVRAVGDVSVVSGLLVFSRQLRQINANLEPQEVVELAHPCGVTAGQVVVHRDHMHTLTCDGVEVGRQRRGQGFALARAHLGNLAVVQGDATGKLHIEVAHLHDPLGALTHHGKSLGQQGIQALTSGCTIAEALRFGPQLIVAQAFESSLHGVDTLDGFAVSLEQAVIATAENLGEEWDGHVN